MLFYPTLLYNVFRNRIQAEFRWWDEIDQPFEESAREGIVSKWEMADIIKVSEEEVSFVTKGDDASFDVVRKSFHPKLKLLLVTEGPKGCRYYTKTFTRRVEGLKVDAVDTTGAGDAFVGGILAQLAEDDTWLEDEKLTKRCTMVCEWLQPCRALTLKERGAILAFVN